jgi:hypothetical protein
MSFKEPGKTEPSHCMSIHLKVESLENLRIFEIFVREERAPEHHCFNLVFETDTHNRTWIYWCSILKRPEKTKTSTTSRENRDIRDTCEDGERAPEHVE